MLCFKRFKCHCIVSVCFLIEFSLQDPEKDETLDELNVVAENMVEVKKTSCDEYLVNVHFTPTVPHCTLATLIGE